MMRDVVNQTGMNITDRMIFLSNDSLRLEILVDGQIKELMLGKYNVNQESNILTIHYNDTLSLRLKILKLTRSDLEIYNFTENKSYRCIRFK